MKPNRQIFTQPIRVSALQAAKRKALAPLKVFVAGPYIEKSWSDADLSGKQPSARLRIEIIKLIETEYAHQVVIGEHRGVVEIGDQNYRSMSSVLVTEIDLVREADCIIIIPSSAGSFCELGAWSREENLCKKMLILADNNHKDKQSYISLGVFKTAEHLSATIEWIDYTDVDACSLIVRRFVDRSEDKAMVRMTLNGN